MARTTKYEPVYHCSSALCEAQETRINWRRLLWIAAFTFFIFNTGWCDWARPVPSCNPLTLKGCFNDR